MYIMTQDGWKLIHCNTILPSYHTPPLVTPKESARVTKAYNDLFLDKKGNDMRLDPHFGQGIHRYTSIPWEEAA